MTGSCFMPNTDLDCLHPYLRRSNAVSVTYDSRMQLVDTARLVLISRTYLILKSNKES